MKNVTKMVFPLLILALSVFSVNSASAQALSLCSALPTVGADCVGTCSPVGQINYNVGPLCSSAVVNMCVVTDGSSLCPSHAAFARVYVNGVLTASGNITAAGSSISFQAPCGSNVSVIVKTKQVRKDIVCVWFGNVDFSLRRQF